MSPPQSNVNVKILERTIQNFQVYSHRKEKTRPFHRTTQLKVPNPSSWGNPSTISHGDPELDLPIALDKQPCSCAMRHKMQNSVTYHLLSPTFHTIVSCIICKHASCVFDAFSHPKCKLTMIDEMKALKLNKTWELTYLPMWSILYVASGYTLKYNPDI